MCERESERSGERERERAVMGPGGGVSSMGTLTSGGDMTRHAGSAQLGQFSVLPCCFGFSFPRHTNTQANHTHIRSFTGQRYTYSHPKCHGFGEKAWGGRGGAGGCTGGRGPWTNGNAKLVTLTLGDKGTLGCRCSC